MKPPANLTLLSDDELLDMRFCDLGVCLEGTPLEARVEQLYEELEARGLNFRPHCWLGEEWFSPDGVPGIAIPFYLAHDRLRRLERKMLLEVEGGSNESCMKILRHEAGHALDTAHRLRRRRSYREMFGKVSVAYPKYYSPKPYSKKYVQHLDMWYAQSHPVEEFAEPFAVWLRPGARWRKQYEKWGALKKLEYVDELMMELRDQPATVRSRVQIEPISRVQTTLREHYIKRRSHYGVDHASVYDADLQRLFSDAREHRNNVTANSFLMQCRRELRRTVARWTGQYEYTIDQVLREMIERCRELKLRLRVAEKQTKQEVLILITVQTMNFLHSGNHRVAL